MDFKKAVLFIMFIIFLFASLSVAQEKSLQQLITEGYKLFKEENYEEAIEIFDRIIEVEPECADAWLYKGYSLSLQGKHTEALLCYEEILRIRPEDVEALFGKGFSLFKNKNYEEALIYFDKALKVDPEYSSAVDYRLETMTFLNEKYPGGYYPFERKNLYEILELDRNRDIKRSLENRSNLLTP